MQYPNLRALLLATQLLGLVNHISAADSKALTVSLGNSQLTMEMSGQNEIIFTAEVPMKTWFGISFGGGMDGKNLMIFQSFDDENEPVVQSFYSTETWTPYDKEPQFILNSKVTKNDKTSTISFTRKLAPDDPNGKTIQIKQGTEIKMSFASNSNTREYDGKKHNKAGDWSFTVLDDGTILYGGQSDYSIYLTHGWLMWGSWGLLGLLQILTNRYLKVFWKVNKVVHIISGTSILIITMTMGLLAIKKSGWIIEIGWHHIMGFITLLAVGLIVIGGIMVGITLNTLRWNTGFVLKMKLGHKIFGYTLIALSQFAILTGGLKWSSFNNDNNPYVIIHICLYFLVLIVCEGIYYKFQERENNFIEPKVTILRSEFKKRVAGGEQLVILDDLVLDISKFKLSHPGGKFLLDYNIGRDVSKFFYGGYTLENGGGCSPHSHSNMARCIVNTLVIARLEEKAKTFAARIVTSTEVGRNTNTFTLKAEGPEVHFKLPSSTDVTAIGRHFLIRSFSNSKVKRHYTVCTCMKKEIYDELCNALRQFQAGERILFNNAVLQENWNSDKSEVVCTVKNYNKRGGVSHRIHTAYNDLYQIKGLLGKGLGIHQEGNHVAFVAGTGILVFVDLVAFLIRQDLNLLDDVQNKILDRKKFKFTLYASFPNEEQVLCHDLIQGLQDIVSKNDEKNFELILRISSQSKQRWDEQFIQRQLEVQTQTDLRKIWVCGPPSMNELFDKTLDANATKYNLNRNQWEIL